MAAAAPGKFDQRVLPGGHAAVRLAGASQLASGNGDIVVFLPRNLAANIEATVASGDVHHIIVDPAIHLADAVRRRPRCWVGSSCRAS